MTVELWLLLLVSPVLVYCWCRIGMLAILKSKEQALENRLTEIYDEMLKEEKDGEA